MLEKGKNVSAYRFVYKINKQFCWLIMPTDNTNALRKPYRNEIIFYLNNLIFFGQTNNNFS